MTSWKTTALGVLAICTALIGAANGVLQGNPVDWTGVVSGVMAGIGLIAARDHGVTSEKAGAK